MKITYMGQPYHRPVRQPRKANGRFSSFKSKAKKFIKGAALWGGSVGLGAFLLSMYFSTTTVTATTPQIVDTMPQKVETLKAGVINQISDCERAGHTEEDGIITFDTNGRASIGVMQFQVATLFSTKSPCTATISAAKRQSLLPSTARRQKHLLPTSCSRLTASATGLTAPTSTNCAPM